MNDEFSFGHCVLVSVHQIYCARIAAAICNDDQGHQYSTPWGLHRRRRGFLVRLRRQSWHPTLIQVELNCHVPSLLPFHSNKMVTHLPSSNVHIRSRAETTPTIHHTTRVSAFLPTFVPPSLSWMAQPRLLLQFAHFLSFSIQDHRGCKSPSRVIITTFLG
jgi:hypothetical protein